jgi:tRNA(His) guanylyltransferase
MGKKKLDALGDRMKGYEAVTKTNLMRRGYTMIRIDGKGFSKYTKGLPRPFDWDLIEDMDDTAKYLCENIQGAKCAFVQSDEITIVITDFDNRDTSAWFKNSLQKMCSVSASMATSKFNQLRVIRSLQKNASPSNFDDWKQVRVLTLAEFDSRVFQLPTRGEVFNNLIWRQQDTVKNSISSVAQSLYGHKELEFKNGADKQELIFQKGQNWNDFDPKVKRGRMIVKETYEKSEGVMRTRWISQAPPTFTQDREFLEELIPNNI